MNNKLKGTLMMIPFLIYCIIVAALIISQYLTVSLGEIVVYLALLLVVCGIALGAFVLAMGGYEKYQQKES